VPGEEYDGSTCYIIAENIRYDEISFVNVPADDFAYVLKVDENENNEEESNKQVILNSGDNEISEYNDVEENEPIQDKEDLQMAKNELSQETVVSADEFNALKDSLNEITDSMKQFIVKEIVSEKEEMLKLISPNMEFSQDAEIERYSKYDLKVLKALHQEMKDNRKVVLDAKLAVKDEEVIEEVEEKTEEIPEETVQEEVIETEVKDEEEQTPVVEEIKEELEDNEVEEQKDEEKVDIVKDEVVIPSNEEKNDKKEQLTFRDSFAKRFKFKG